MAGINDIYQSKWLTASDLKNQHKTFTIERVTTGIVGSGADAKPQLILNFHEHEKPLGLNKTNAQAIASCYGEDYEDWVGESVVLFPTTVDFQGEMKAAIRVNKKDTMAIVQNKLRAQRTAASRSAPAGRVKPMTQAEIGAEEAGEDADIPF